MSARPLASFLLPALICVAWCLLALGWAWGQQAELWPFFLLAALSLIGGVVLGSCRPTLQLFGGSVNRGSRAGDCVALTFDDGPDPVHTPRVLDILDQWGARGTFFVVGEAAEAVPELVREIVDRGHQVAHHSYSHRWQQIFRPRELASDLQRGLQAIRDASGRAPRFFRPPIGLVTPELLGLLRSVGMQLVAWSVRPLDGMVASGEKVRERVASKIRAGDIVLLHDAARHGLWAPPAVEALPGILDDLDRRGLRSVSVAELLDEPAYMETESLPKPVVQPRTLPFFLAVTVLALLFGTASEALAEESVLPPSLVEAAAELGQAATVQARFRQTKTSVLFVEPVVQEGTLKLRRSDGRLLWLYDEGPALLMAEGRFYPAGVTQEEAGAEASAGYSMPGGGAPGRVFEALFTLEPSLLAEHFTARELEAGRYELKPRAASAAALMTRVILTLGGKPTVPKRIEMEEATGDQTAVEFLEVSLDEPVAAESFLTPAERSESR